MSQVLEQDITQSDEFCKTEGSRLLEEIRLKNVNMDKTQKNIDRLKKDSDETLKRIDLKIQEIESILI